MKIFNATKMGDQPLVWRQAASKEKNRGWSVLNSILYPILNPIHKYFYEGKNNPSLIVDELIVGSNPIINLLKLYEISKLNSKLEHKKVAIFFIEQFDYWAYTIIQEKDFFTEIEKSYGIKVNSIEDLVATIINNISYEFLDLYIIKEKKLRINYYNKDEEINGWILHLMNKTEGEEPAVKEYIKVQNDIRNKIEQNLFEEFEKQKNIKQVKWGTLDETAHPIVCSKKIILTSLPQGWINMDSENKNGIVYFKHEAEEFSYGSAKCIGTTPELLREISYKQLNN